MALLMEVVAVWVVLGLAPQVVWVEVLAAMGVEEVASVPGMRYWRFLLPVHSGPKMSPHQQVPLAFPPEVP